jgi:SAM-dependent methyltransferase
MEYDFTPLSHNGYKAKKLDLNYSKVPFNVRPISQVRPLRKGQARRLVKIAEQSGYLAWPRKIEPLVWSRRVLDVGCGPSLHSIGYLLAGASGYFGFDPFLDISSSLVKSKKSGEKLDTGVPMKNLGKVFRNLSYGRTLEDYTDQEPFDLAVLHNVTEHVPALDLLLADVSEKLTRDGILVFHHHNFFAWDGHHANPKLEEDVDFSNVEHVNVVDWAHIRFDPPPNHAIVRGTLNKIGLDSLHQLVSHLFDIELWDEIESPKGRGGGRFHRIPQDLLDTYGERNLRVKNVLCVARKKPPASHDAPVF